MENIVNWIKANKLIAAVIALIAAFLFMPRLFGAVRRRRVRRKYAPVRVIKVKNRPRRKIYTKGGKAKKPWQIKGSLAARRRMAQIRRMK